MIFLNTAMKANNFAKASLFLMVFLRLFDVEGCFILHIIDMEEIKMSIQSKIENYWEDRATDYSTSIWREMESFKKDAWMKMIAEYRPEGQSLKVLDIGTGPGFFCYDTVFDGSSGNCY
ncbi:hypothetical protein [Clostridium formicaceticum]|uniref:hypothetical protein n=1 Tax=Clostridium formicaceticum TaxID=1497 RepID=UPI001F2C340C|nr:hypothetical protein [Clostridium formicaceticum]